MRRSFIREQILSTKIDPLRWLVLERKGRYDWTLRVVGPEPLNTELVELTGNEAKAEAVSVANEHFREMNPSVRIAPFRHWEVAMFVERPAT